jgi:hypothetical protein
MNKNFGLSQYTVWDHEEDFQNAALDNPFEGAEQSREHAIKGLLGER